MDNTTPDTSNSGTQDLQKCIYLYLKQEFCIIGTFPPNFVQILSLERPHLRQRLRPNSCSVVLIADVMQNLRYP